MPTRQTRSEIEQAYLGNTDPVSQTTSMDSKSMLTQALLAIAGGAGSRAATGAVGGAAAEPTPAPAGDTRTTTLFDDRTERPKMGAKDYLIQGLIPLAAGLLGGIGGGNRGAMVGAKAGLDAIGKEHDEQEKRYDKLEDDKTRARSSVITAKVLKGLGGADGDSGRNKNRYIFDEAMDPKTKAVYFVKKDRESGDVELVDRAGNLVPYSKDLYDRLRPSGTSTVSGIAPPAAPEQTPAPAPIAAAPRPAGKRTGDVTFGPIKGMNLNPDGLPTDLPKDVMKPGGSAAAPTPENAPVDTQKFGEVPRDLEPNDYDSILKEFRQGLKPQIQALDQRIAKYGAMIDHPEPIGNENELDARRRVANAEKALAKAEDERLKFDERVAKTIADIQKAKVESSAKDRRAGAASTGGTGSGTGGEFSGKMSQREKDSKLSDKQVDETSDYDKAIAAAEDIIGKSDDSIVGPIDGRKRGPLLKKGQADFNSAVGRISDSYRKLITGAGAGNGELQKLESRLPQATDWDKAEFEEKAKAYLESLRRERGIFMENLKRRGKDTRNFQTPATGGKKSPADVDKMSDEEVEAQLRSRGLLK